MSGKARFVSSNLEEIRIIGIKKRKVAVGELLLIIIEKGTYKGFLSTYSKG